MPTTCPLVCDIAPTALFEIISVLAPVDIFPDVRLRVPATVSFTLVPPSVTPAELFIVRLLNVVAAVPVMLCADPPLNVTVPLLCVKVLLLLKSPATLKVPDVEMREPEVIVSPLRVTAVLPKLKIPAPSFVKLFEAEENVPPIVSVLAETVTCLLLFMVTAPVPRFSVFEPVNIKSPFRARG